MRPMCLSFIAVSLFGVPFRAQAEPGDSAKPRLIEVRGKAYEVYPPDRLRARGIAQPEIPDEENAALVYIDAMNHIVPLAEDLYDAQTAALGGAWPEGEAGERLADWLAKNQAAIDLARQASAMPQYCLPYMRGSTDAVVGILLPTLPHSRELARILAVDASRRIALGDGKAAAERLVTMQRMGAQMSNGIMIEGLVGMSICALADVGLIRLADSGTADAETLKSVVADMEALRSSLPDFEDIIRAEQRFGDAYIEDMLDSPSLMAMTAEGPLRDPGRTEDSPWQKLQAELLRVYVPDRAMKRHLNGFYDGMIAATKSEEGTPREISEEEHFQRVPAWDQISRVMLPSIARVYELTLRSESNFRRTQLRLAAEAYRAERGAYPTTLAELAPAIIPEVPADPMTGYDFPYAVAPGAKPSGLEQVTRDNESQLAKLRKTPAILTPRSSRWRRFVRHYARTHEFTAKQQASAEAILRDVEARAAAFERAEGRTLQSLVDEGRESDAAARMGPLNKLNDELKSRLAGLLDAKQRAAAAARKEKQP